VLFSALLAFITTKVYFCLSVDDQLFEDVTEKMKSLPISSFLQIIILNFYGFLWYISTQLLYIEFKTRYINIIKEFKKEVINEKFKTDSDVLKLTQKFVLKFVNFKSDIKSIVDFLKCKISIEIFSTISSIIIYAFIYLSSKPNSIILYIVLLVGYYLWTMSCNLRIRIIDNDLSFILNKWLNLNPKDSIRIKNSLYEK
jgi:hypothetical protein